MSDTQFAADIDSQLVLLDDPSAVPPGSRLTDDVHALVHVEEAALVLIDTDTDDDFVKHRECTFQNIQMTCSEGIE